MESQSNKCTYPQCTEKINFWKSRLCLHHQLFEDTDKEEWDTYVNEIFDDIKLPSDNEEQNYCGHIITYNDESFHLCNILVPYGTRCSKHSTYNTSEENLVNESSSITFATPDYMLSDTKLSDMTICGHISYEIGSPVTHMCGNLVSIGSKCWKHSGPSASKIYDENVDLHCETQYKENKTTYQTDSKGFQYERNTNTKMCNYISCDENGSVDICSNLINVGTRCLKHANESEPKMLEVD